MTCSVRTAAITSKPNVVSVNGTVIPRDVIAREVQQHPAQTPLMAWKDAARALAVRELLLQEARRLEVSGETLRDGKGRRETEDEAAIRTLIEREVAVPSPDEKACRRYYEQNLRRFRSAAIYEAAHILIAADARDQSAYRAALERAKAIRVQLVQAPTRFAELARETSDCPSAAQGGNLGQITAGQTTPEFERALEAQSPGELSPEPVATRYGFHLIRLDRKIDGRQLPFEAVAERIADYLAHRVTQRATAQYVARLAARAQISGIELASPSEHRVY
jgi:peptidyl-prolyl cis-trans isomerase C